MKTEDFDFGEVLEGETKKVSYQRKSNLPAIKRIETSCGCTEAGWSPDSRTVFVTYHAPAGWPEGVSGDTYKTSKYMTLYFNDGTNQTIWLKGVIKKK
nr:hypothetical protein [uncultured Arsenicibacter sp.]